MTGNSVLLPQSVLGALIAVNLKNSLKQLADPYYLWKKSKLDCVSSRRPRVPVMPGTPGTASSSPTSLALLSVVPLVSCSLISTHSVAKLYQTLCDQASLISPSLVLCLALMHWLFYPHGKKLLGSTEFTGYLLCARDCAGP